MKQIKQPDLFGGQTTIKRRESPFDHLKRIIRYRPAEGEKSCKTCANLATFRYQHTYYKCAEIGISNSSATDVRLKYVCDKWKEKEDEK